MEQLASIMERRAAIVEWITLSYIEQEAAIVERIASIREQRAAIVKRMTTKTIT